MSATGSQSGTTLIEALAVVALTALVALIGFPRLQSALAGYAQRETVSVVTARLRQVQADAMRQGRPRLFEVGPDGRGFGASGWAYAQAPSGVRLRASEPISFFGDGSSSGGTVRVGAGRAMTEINVARATGAVIVGGR